MKTSKIITLIASIFFLLAALGTFKDIPKYRSIVANGNAGNGSSMLIAPIVEIVFAVGSFLFWLYLRRKEKNGLAVTHARLISMILIVLSIALSWGLTIWLIILPIYNLS